MFHRRIATTTLAALATAFAVGCAAENADETAATEGEVVGVTDLALLEQAFDLVPASAQRPSSDAALRAGKCYGALVENGPGWPEFEFRRYANGAAFFAKRGSGYNSGDKRPVLCVDLHQGAVATHAFGGVVLDAILRYDLGRMQGGGENLTTGDAVWQFQRGVLHLKGLPEAERIAAAQKRPHELDLEKAPSVSGSLEKITLKNVRVSNMYVEEPMMRDVELEGSTAFFTYRYAWRRAENTGVFTVARDAVGVFKGEAEIFGDGPGYGSTFHFTRGDAFRGGYYEMLEDGEGALLENISFGPPNRPADRAPLAECSRRTPDGAETPPFSCTGI